MCVNMCIYIERDGVREAERGRAGEREEKNPWLGIDCRQVRFSVQGSGFRVQSSGFGVHGAGFRVQGSGSRVQGSGFGVEGAGCRVQGAGLGFEGAGCHGSASAAVRCASAHYRGTSPM